MLLLISKNWSKIIGYGGLVLGYSVARKNDQKVYIKLLKLFGLAFLMKLFAFIKGGPIQSSLHILFGINRPKIVYDRKIYKDQYKKVFEAFDYNFRNGFEQGAQLCVYVKGEKVIDLCANYENNKLLRQEYNAKSMQTIFSSTKSVSAIALAILVDRGLVDYSDKICKHWPEFAQNGKQNIKIEDLMRHEGGLHDISFEFDEIQRDQIKQNVIGKAIEDQEPYWPAHTTRMYHSISRGWVIGEILRRVDPQKRTIGEFIQDEISNPLHIDMYVGLPLEKLNQTTFMSKQPQLWLPLQTLLPQIFRKTDFSFGLFIKYIKMIKQMSNLKDNTRKHVKKAKGTYNFADQTFLTGEASSANGQSNAQSMAILAKVMAEGGAPLISPETYKKMHDKPVVQQDGALMNLHTNFTQGGVNLYDRNCQMSTRNQFGFYGWQGRGGSVLQWHPEHKIGFAYAMNSLHPDQNVLSFKLLEIFFGCYQQNR